MNNAFDMIGSQLCLSSENEPFNNRDDTMPKFPPPGVEHVRHVIGHFPHHAFRIGISPGMIFLKQLIQMIDDQCLFLSKHQYLQKPDNKISGFPAC